MGEPELGAEGNAGRAALLAAAVERKAIDRANLRMNGGVTDNLREER